MQQDEVRTRKISEIEMAIDAPKCKKSHSVRAGVIETPTDSWQEPILPLNYTRIITYKKNFQSMSEVFLLIVYLIPRQHKFHGSIFLFYVFLE